MYIRSADVMDFDYLKWTKGLTKEQLHHQVEFCKQRYKQ